MKKLLTAIALLTATPSFASTAYTIDSVRFNGYHTMIEITVNVDSIRKIDCRGYKDGKITGTKTFYVNGETGWFDGALLMQNADRVKCMAKWN
jgi:hypothetical protein